VTKRTPQIEIFKHLHHDITDLNVVNKLGGNKMNVMAHGLVSPLIFSCERRGVGEEFESLDRVFDERLRA
jgi:hypothetical protein